MEKYYTPEISEFHFGFTFEVFISFSGFFMEGAEEGWKEVTMTFGVLGDLINIQRLILDKQVRVKYLDQQDIEAEGWVYSGGTVFSKNDNWLYFHSKNRIEIEDSVNQTVFDGTIKNRSELQKVMQQLGIK